jgi:hypothetical protein
MSRSNIQLGHCGSKGPCPSASPYVQLSRARTRIRLSILRPFSPDELLSPLPEALKLELSWQEQKAKETEALYKQI